MAPVNEPKDPVLRSVYWREEIIEVVLWLRGEGFDERVDARMLERFLGLEREEAAGHLARLAHQGYMRQLDGGRYVLTEAGEEEAQQLVDRARSVPAPEPGACGSECWCHASPVEASRCEGGRKP